MYGRALYTMTEIRLVMSHFSVVRIKQKMRSCLYG